MARRSRWRCLALALLLVAHTSVAGDRPAPADAQYVKGGRSVGPLIELPVERLGLNPYARAKTAHDFVRDNNLRGMVESAVGSSDVILAVTPLDQRSALERKHASGEGIFFNVVFHDGSSVVIRVDRDHANGRYERGSARAADGAGIADGT